MKSNEQLEKYLELKNHILLLDEYLEFIKNEQVREVIYKEDNNFDVLTDDGDIFKIKVYDHK